MAGRHPKGSASARKAVADLRSTYGATGAARRLGVTPSTVDRVVKHGIATPDALHDWSVRLQAANPRGAVEDIRATYKPDDVARALGVSKSQARAALSDVVKRAARDPEGAAAQARTLLEAVEEKGYRLVNGVRIYQPGTNLLPARMEFKSGPTGTEQEAVSWVKDKTKPKYFFAIQTPRGYLMFVDLDLISEDPRDRRSQFGKEGARARWRNQERQARRRIREYNKRTRYKG